MTGYIFAALLLVCAAYDGLQAFTFQSYRRPGCSTYRQNVVYGGGSVTRTCLNESFQPLAREGDWKAYQDEEGTGLVYYFNDRTGESLWEPPTSSFPTVRLSRRRMDILREKQGIETFEEKASGFLSKMFSGRPAESEINDGGGSVSTIEKVETTEREKKKGGGAFSFFVTKTDDDDVPVVDETALSEDMDNTEADFMRTDGSSQFSFAEVFRQKTVNAVSEIAAQQESTITEVGGGDMPQVKAKPSFSFPDLSSVFKAKPTVEDVIIPSEIPIQIDVSAQVLPHPEKISWGGEDAVFLKGRTFGVFDGVSGAEKLDGLELYSTTLAQQMATAVAGKWEKNGMTQEEMMAALLAAAEYADENATGASTACVASVGEDGFLRVINLGDSVCMVVRDGEIVAKTKENLHYFDCPFQLALDSPDRPKDCTRLKAEVLEGDVILMGSDGVFDNLTDEEVCDAVAAVPGGKSIFVAKSVVDISRRVSLDETAETPYAKLAKRNRYPDYKNGLGGKVDDISCIAVRCS